MMTIVDGHHQSPDSQLHVLDIDFIAYRGSQMPKDCSDGKVGVASITQRGRQVVAEVVVAYILVTRLALKISSGDARRGC
jgi:hypothetical protein